MYVIFSSKNTGQLNETMIALKMIEQGEDFNIVVTISKTSSTNVLNAINASVFAPSITAAFNVTENISFLCIFYFDYNRLFLEILCPHTCEKVFPVHIGENVIEVEANRYMKQVGEREEGKNYLIEELSFVTNENALYFSAGTYCRVGSKQADFVYKINYNAKQHAANLSNSQIERKWQKVFSISPNDPSNVRHLIEYGQLEQKAI